MGARLEEYKEDSIIIHEGERRHRMYVVLEGEVILYSKYGTDDEYLIGAYGKNTTFGESNLFVDEPYRYTAIAYSNVKVAWFEKNNLLSFIEGYPNSALGLIEKIILASMNTEKKLQLAIDEINSIKYSIPHKEEKPNEVKNEETPKEPEEVKAYFRFPIR